MFKFAKSVATTMIDEPIFLTITKGKSSFSFFDQQGLIQNNSFRKYDIRINPEFKISDKLTLNGVFGYTNNKTINPSKGSAEFIIRQAIDLPAIGGGRYGPGIFG